jgi:hypothetical protein
MAKKENHNPIITRPGINIGSVAAENDQEFLEECFVRHPSLEALLDANSKAAVLVGRTGAGKTAVLQHILENNRNCCELNPANMALNYIANSDIIRFLHDIGADLDLLFQALWKHVLCIEYIRLRYKTIDEHTTSNFLRKIADYFGGEKHRRKDIEYLIKWEGQFFISMDENIKEIVSKTENSLEAALGGEVRKIKAKANYAKRLSSERKSEIINRTKTIINGDQLSELNKVLDLLKEFPPNRDGEIAYILIDNLDERWVDDSVKFLLIGALVEGLRSFRKIPNLKIAIAMRTDILERVMSECKSLRVQREKIRDCFVYLNWDKAALQQVVDTRLQHLFKRKYTSKAVNLSEVFPKRGRDSGPFDYIVERTLYRPRDVIAFVNSCLSKLEKDVLVSMDKLKLAESEYSRARRQALEDEWQTCIPCIPQILAFLAGGPATFKVGDISDQEILEKMALQIATNDFEFQHDLVKSAQRAVDENSSCFTLRFAKEAFAALYRVGAVGVKLRPDNGVMYSYRDDPIIHDDVMTDQTTIRVHPMLHRSLNIIERTAQPNAREMQAAA